MADMRNFHLPLPDEVYRDLRAEADRTSKPATALARQAIELWLGHRRKVARHEAISAFAAQYAGGPWDLDADLEIASTEHLISTDEEPC
jgi:predicted transcriptional regulator